AAALFYGRPQVLRNRCLFRSGAPAAVPRISASGAKQTTLESKPERSLGRRSVEVGARRAAPPARGPRRFRRVRSWRGIVAFTHPRTGGAYDSHHRTAGIAGRTRRHGSSVAARGGRAAARAHAAHRRAYALRRVGTRGKASGAQRRIMGPRKSQLVVCAAEEGWLISNPHLHSPPSRCCAHRPTI